MASAEKYAAWIVANANKRGTPDFDTVAKAYQEAKALTVSRPADSKVSQRRAELDIEERAAQEKLARVTQKLESYDQSTIGKLLAAPSRLFGGESFAEEQLAKRKADAAEVAKRVNRERAFMEREGRVAPTPTFGEYVTAGLKAPARGAIEGTSQFLGTLGVTGSEGEQTARAMEERGTALAKSLGLGASETAEFDPLMRNIETFGGGLGSVIPYLGAEVVGQKLKPLTKAAPYIARGAQTLLATGQGATQARQQMDDFEKETGQEIDPTTRKLVQAGGGAIGLTELLPIGRMVDSLPGPLKTAVNKRITDIVAQTGAGKLLPEAARTAIRETLQAVESRAVGRVVTRGALPEALQEGGAQLAQNVLERATYNPEQDVMEGVAENAIFGGLVGGTVRGGFEATKALGRRAADNRQKLFEQTAPPVEEFDINVRSIEDPTQMARQRVQRLTDPDEEGNVFARRADGTTYQTSMAELYRMRVPTEGIRAVSIPETLSAPVVTQRLTAALGETSPDLDVGGFIKNVTTTLNNNMALGTPESTEDYIQKQQNSLRRARISEEERIARMLVLDEAVKLNNEYLNLVTAPPEGTPPSAPTGAPAPAATEQATILSDEAIQAQVDSAREQAAQRAAALEEITSDPNQIDKVSIFADRMTQSGLAAPTPVEVARLNDALRAESEAETAAGREKDTSERQKIIDRTNIIERTLFDDRIAPDKKVERINKRLRDKGYTPLYRRETEYIGGYETANAVFGPEGEYAQRRQELLDQVIADPTITDKYRGFAEALDQYPELGDPSVAETRMLRGDAAPLEAQITQSREPITTARLPAEPGGLPAEIIERGAAPTLDEVTAPTLDVVEEPDVVTAPTPDVTAAPTPDVTAAPTPDVTAAPALEGVTAPTPDVTAAPTLEGAPAPAPALPAPTAAPQGALVAEETIDAAPAEAPRLETEAAEVGQLIDETLTSKEKQVAAEAYDATEYNETVRDNLANDVIETIKEPGRLASLKAALRPIVKKLMSAVMAVTIVVNTTAASRLSPTHAATFNQVISTTETSPVRKSVPAAARPSMSDRAVEAYETLAPGATRTGKGFVIADKSAGMLHIFDKNGKHLSSTSALFGRDAGDTVVDAREAVAGSKTPAGEFRLMRVEKSGYAGGVVYALINPQTGNLVWSQAPTGKAAFVAMHGLVQIPGQNRLARLMSATTADNKISAGCINTTDSVIVDVLEANASQMNGGALFVLPDETVATDTAAGTTTTDTTSDAAATPAKDSRRVAAAQERQVRGGRPRRLIRKLFKGRSIPDEQTFEDTDEPTAATQTVNNSEEDVIPAEEQLEADPNTIEGAFPASLNRPRAEAIGFAADMERRVKSMSSRFFRAANYKYQNAEDYARALAASYGLTRLPPNLNVARKFEMLESRKIGGQMRLNRWYLQPIEDKVKELGLDPKDVGMYLWARSAPARNALVLERSKGEDINGSGMTDAQARAQLDKLEFEGLGPALRKVAKMHDALVDYVGNQRVKAGLLSQEDWRAMRKAQPFYTPLKGYALNGDMQVDGDPDPHSDEERGIAENNGTRIREVLTARGRESMPFNPLFNLMSDAQFAIARIEQNKVKETFLNNILSDPKSHEGLVTVYTPKKEVHASGLTTMPKMERKSNGEYAPANMNALAAQKNPTLVIVKKDGKPYYIEFARTPAGNALYRAFANMTPPELGKFMQVAQVVANTLKSFKTRYNPIYIGTTAWARDFNEAIVTAYAAQGIKGGPAVGTKLGKRTARYIASLSGMDTISDYLRGKDPTTAEGEVLTLLFDQFLEDGGAVGHAQIMDAERYAQDTAKTIKRYAAAKRGKPGAAALMAKDMTAKALDNASQLIDLQARFATYRAAIEEKISRDDAAALALDSSLNLTRRGELSPYLDTLAFFFSPTVEGARKLLSQGRYSTIARKLFSTAVMTGALIYLFNRFGPGAGDDDEDGRPNILEVNNVTAQSRMIFRYGPGVNDYAAVPVAFGMGFFNYAGGQIMAAVLNDIPPEEAGFNIVGGFMNMASPIKTEGTEGLTSIVNFVVPDPAQPLWDLVVNRSAFGSKIYSDKSQYGTLPKSELGREETGDVWKFIARGMNSLVGGTDTVEKWTSIQPEQYRYIVQQLLGGAYGFGRDTVDLVAGEAKPDQMLANRIPIIKSFFGRGGEFAPMNKFYEDYDELNALYAVYNDKEPDPEKQAENEAKFPMQSNPEIMEAFGDALSALRKINKDNRDDAYDSRESMLKDKNEVYKEFNRTYAEAKRKYRE